MPLAGLPKNFAHVLQDMKRPRSTKRSSKQELQTTKDESRDMTNGSNMVARRNPLSKLLKRLRAKEMTEVHLLETSYTLRYHA